jgi:ABC-type antimicrobial peptide transport system permease subunit
LIAVPIGVALAYGISSLLPFGDIVAFEFPVGLIPVGLVGILVIATLSSIGPSMLAARKTVSEILRYQ